MLQYTFYDSEATDVHVRHGQMTQFGGITCGEDFGIAEKISQYIRLLPWVVPHPGALAVTKKNPSDLTDHALPSEYEAARTIQRFLLPPRGVTRVYVTYNGLRFDNELLRTTFYRNFLNPWFNSGRNTVNIDLLPLVRLVHSVDADAITVPTDGEGAPIFKLDRLCPANGIALDAHDAYHDSVGTMQLFRLVQERAPWAVELAMKCGSESAVEAMIADARRDGLPLYRFTHFSRPDIAPVFPLAYDGKRHMVFDTRGEVFAGTEETPADIAGQLFKKGSFFSIIQTNKFPILMTPAFARERLGLDPESLRHKINEINSKESLLSTAKAALSINTVETSLDNTSEERIYDGYLDDQDKREMAAFNRAANWLDRAQVSFKDPRLRDFSARIVLEAVKRGDARLPHDVIEGLMHDCAEALTRPFREGGNRWTEIAQCLSDGADQNWVDWAIGRYGDHPVFSTACGNLLQDTLPAPETARGQLAFGFA
jgi:exodeoxyribonuclease-1